jgi:hypothetical protein
MGFFALARHADRAALGALRMALRWEAVPCWCGATCVQPRLPSAVRSCPRRRCAVERSRAVLQSLGLHQGQGPTKKKEDAEDPM